MKPYHATTTTTAFLRLLQISPFQQRSGGWRFGCKRISDDVVARLVASGRARIDGLQLVRVAVPAEMRPASKISSIIHADRAMYSGFSRIGPGTTSSTPPTIRGTISHQLLRITDKGD